jgi:hypothetical protein
MPVSTSTKTHKRHKRKSKYSDSEDENEPEEGIPKMKLLFLGAVVIVCLFALWPSLFGPLMSMITGRTTQPESQSRPQHPPVHPALNRQGASAGPSPRGHMHPAAMRMAQGEAAQQQGSSGRGGLFSYLLPVYTIGVMVFLVYTLSKIMFKKKPKRKRQQYGSECSESEESEAEGNNLSRGQLRSLQKRLYETETAMSKILEQLEDIAQTQPNDSKDNKNLTDEQVKTVEASMKQLSELSKTYKEQKAELGVESEEGEEDEENDSEMISPVTTPESSDNEEMKKQNRAPTFAEVVKKEPSPLIESQTNITNGNIKAEIKEEEKEDSIKTEPKNEEKDHIVENTDSRTKVRRRARRD